jgi:hypothetical protein
MPAPGDRTWNVPVNGNAQIVDAINAVGDLCVTTHEVPSASLLINVAGGLFLGASNQVNTYAGAISQPVTASATTSIYLTNAGVLSFSTTGFPAPPTLYVPLAVVVAGVSTITSITDARVAFTVAGSGYLPLLGGALADGANVVLGSSTGNQIGTASSQKLGFLGATPVVQQTLGVKTAGATYGTNEQTMLQLIYNLGRAFGFGS